MKRRRNQRTHRESKAAEAVPQKRRRTREEQKAFIDRINAAKDNRKTETRPVGENRRPKRKATPQTGDPLEAKILQSLGGRPLDKVEIAKAIGMPPAQRSRLRDVLRKMEIAGDIARIRKDRYIIPGEADLFTGTMQFHASGSAHVLNERAGEPDLFVSAENTFTAMHGDKVVARVMTERRNDWMGNAGPARKEGRVIRILQRANDTVVGTLQKSKNFYYVVADDPRFVHNLYVQAPAAPVYANVGDKVVARLDAWPSRHVNPEGHIIEVLGPVGKPGVDMLSIIRKHRLPTFFPPEVLQEAEEIAPEVPAREAARREDVRGKFVFTIDPDDARDFDDAIQVEKAPDGWSIGIHIADVSHYVRPKSALDREAVSRGNSVYLADRVIPMLPEALSNGICSLKPDVDRLAFSVFAEISAKGKIKSVRFAKTVIRSAARLTYKKAFEILSRPPGGDQLAQHVHTAWAVSSLLRKLRFAGGSLDLDFPEVKVWLDKDGRPERMERIENDISHQLIEEMMLLANELVARELKNRRQAAVYRVHEKPDPDKLAEFREFAGSFGIRCGDLTNRPELEKLLAGLKGQPHAGPVKIALLKSLKRARYAPEPLGHFGLAKPNYTHFTSPIRRYSDLIVHRSLERLLGLAKHGPDAAMLATTCEHISATERVAAEAEKESVRLKKLEYFQIQCSSRAARTFKATIMDVRNFGFFVDLPEFLLGGLVHISSLEDDFFVFDGARRRLVGRRSRKTYQAGEEIEVAVARVDMFKQQVDFKVAK